ncbi:MAG: ferredoxin domain-containing protein [Betaproteobacteria bacterium]
MDEVLKLAAELMALSARTAPKAAGKDFVVTKVVAGDELVRLAEDMEHYGQESGKKNFDRDGRNVRQSAAVLLVGLSGAQPLGLNCGACGHARCADLPKAAAGPEFAGPWCAWRLMDLGIALGSAAKTASLLNVDNRLMYRIGVSARRLGLIEADVVCGVPLSATGKSPYFDR